MVQSESDRSTLDRLHGAFGTLNDLLLIPMFTVMLLESGTSGEQAWLLQLSNLGFCASFFIEWLLGLLCAEDKRAYGFAPDRLLDLVSCIPFGSLFQAVRLVRVLRVLRVFRIAVRARRYRGAGQALLRMATVVGCTVFAGALGLRIVEPDTTAHFPDALWWSVVTVSTVGYGDIVPTSDMGRMIAGVLICCGVGVVGYIAGVVASLMDPHDYEREILVATARLQADILRVHQHLGIESESTVASPGTAP
jgi:voltage-gated potassium channel